MTVTVAGDDTLNAVIGSAALNVQVKSQNAVINVNGIQIVRQSNTITDALHGVTLTLKAPSTADETLTIARSTDDNKKPLRNGSMPITLCSLPLLR